MWQPVSPKPSAHKECAVFMGNTPEQVTELCRWLENTSGSSGTQLQHKIRGTLANSPDFFKSFINYLFVGIERVSQSGCIARQLRISGIQGS